jgi:hypothetical protein
MDRQFARAGAAAAMAGGAFALAGNIVAPRYVDMESVEIYHKVGTSDRFLAANLLILVALLLTTVGFVAIGHAIQDSGQWAAGRLGVLAASVGGTIAIVQAAIETYAYRQEAIVFVNASESDRAGSFWATDSLEKVNNSLFSLWTIVFLGLAPIALGVAMRHVAAFGQLLGSLGAVGGILCVVVGAINLMRSDQDVTVIPFAVGSVLVTIWILWGGYRLSKLADVAEPAAAEA